MERYLAFLGDDYYPNGGMNDFLSDHKTVEEAKMAIEKEVEKEAKYHDNEYLWEQRWAHIYDTVERKIVWNK